MNRYCIFLLCCFAACKNHALDNTDKDSTVTSVAQPLLLHYQVKTIYPHDTSAFTEGLFWYEHTLYESTGGEGHSRLIQSTIPGGIVKDLHLPGTLFGEGITRLNNKLYQLTWQNNMVLVYDAASLKKTGSFRWPHEGWGLTTNGQELIVGTGKDTLYFVDPAGFAVTRYITVSNINGAVEQVNELEYINGYIYGNVWHKEYILKIDPVSGKVVAQLDLSGIREKNGITVDRNPEALSEHVLNGIAFDSSRKSLYITGKHWPVLFELKVDGL